MRILQVIQEMGTGGAESVVLSLVDGANAAGHSVAVAAGKGNVDDGLRCPRFDLPLIGRRRHRVLAAVWRLNRVLRGWRPTLVHCHNPTMAIVASLATARGSKIPALVSVHGVPDDDYPRAGRMLRWAGLPVIPCGPGVAEALKDEGVPIGATIVNGVSSPPTPSHRKALMSRWGLSEDLGLVVTVGRLVHQKNQALAMRAIARLPQTALAIVGEGPEHGKLEDLRTSLRLTDRVVIAGARPDARAIIGAADALVISSHWEGLPLVALEAMTARTPFVATAVRGIRELVADEVHCLLVKPDDPDGLASAIARILGDKRLRQHLIDESARMAATFSVDTMVTLFLDLYRELIAERAETRPFLSRLTHPVPDDS